MGDKKKGAKQIAIGSALVGTGVALDSKKFRSVISKLDEKYARKVAAGSNDHRKTNFFTGQNQIDKVNKRYDKILAKIYDVNGHNIPGSYENLNNIKYYDGKRFGAVRKSIPGNSLAMGGSVFAHLKPPSSRPGLGKINTNVKNLPIILHEMGHLEQHKGKSLIVGKQQAFRDFHTENLSKYYQNRNSVRNPPWIDTFYSKRPKVDLAIHKAKHFAKKYPEHLARKATLKVTSALLGARHFAMEMEANAKAIKFAKQLRGKKGNKLAWVTAKSMGPNILGYSKNFLHKSAKLTLAAAGAVAVVKGVKTIAAPNNDRKVMFRRIHGRIVPIRAKGNK